MPEWGFNEHVEIYGCHSPCANDVYGGLRRLRRRADRHADLPGDSCFYGHTGCGPDACTNPSADTGADPDVHAGTHTYAYPCADAAAETHA